MPKRPEWVTLWKKMESLGGKQEVRGEILISFQLIPIEEVLKVPLVPTLTLPLTLPLALTLTLTLALLSSRCRSTTSRHS